MLYSCPDACSFAPAQALLYEVPGPIQAAFFEGMETFSAIFIADSFLNRSCFTSANLRGWQDIGIVRDGSGPARGFTDGININSVEPDGTGCWFGSARPERAPIGDEIYLTLIRLSRHLAAAHRLRRRHADTPLSPDVAEAVLDPGGRVQHAVGPARKPTARSTLARATQTMDRARRRLAGADPREAIKDWKSVVSKRWSLVEHFDTDGKRFTLAMANRPTPPSLELLSARERDVVLRALAGQDNKVIAYALSLAPSTVRVLIWRAAAKLNVRTRRDLCARLAGGKAGS
jgi:DNA-binding CsgD family transcriptional regulator